MNISLETRRIGTIDFNLTVLALGCWSFGGSAWGGQKDEDSIDAINSSLEAGVNNFDTAQGYGNGRSERICGEHLKTVRDKVFIATKASARSKEKMLEAVDVSLGRLRTDYIDLYYIHWPKTDFDLRPCMEALESARSVGKIRGIGVSNFSIEQMEQVMEVGTIDAHQLCYNLFWRWDEKDIIPFCQEHNIAYVTYSSIAQGILTGKFGRHPQFPEDDHRSGTVLFGDDAWPHVYEGVEQLKKIAAKVSRPLTDLAIQWVAAQPGITSVIVGARNDKQARQNVAAMKDEIDASVFEKMTAISDEVIKHIPDTGNIFRYYP